VTTTDPTLRRLLGAVLADPADDTARLVYADAMEEAGDGERASHVRWMVAHPDAGQSFVGGHDSLGWFPATHAMGDRTVFTIRRGFIAEVRCTLAAYEAHAAALFAAQPITAVFLTGVRPFNLNDDPAYPFVFGFNKGAVTGEGSQWLPEAVYDLLQGAAAGDEVVANGRIRVKAYTSASLAADALGAALVTHGRRLARLDVPCGTCDTWGIDTIHDEATGRTDHVKCPRCKGTGWVLNTGE
jgi:uncharacterized protein (TIGR02996 family)